MKITYTAEDGTNFQTEADCLGWERFNTLKKEAVLTQVDPDDPESYDEELESFIEHLSGEHGAWFGGLQLWNEREKLYRLVD